MNNKQLCSTVYCAGSNCAKRYTCAKYYTSGTAVDWSTYGSGGTDLKDTYYCGPYSDPPYAKFQPCNQTDDGYDTVALGKPSHVFSLHEGGSCYAFGKNYLNPWTTLEIKNCEKIILKSKSVEFEAELPTKHFDEIEEIIINGNKFVKEKKDGLD